MDSQISQRVWVITGANSGLGLAIASYVLSKGDKVIATVRSLNKFRKPLREQGARPLLLDLSATDKEIKRSAEDALQAYGHVDVLVNNAGWGVPSPWEEADMDEVKAQFQTLLFGIISLTQSFLTHFRTRRTGHILNVSSAGSFGTSPSWGAYNAAKGALNLARVLNIVPGYFPTEFIATVDAKKRPVSRVYTELSQGYDSARLIYESHRDAGQIGDVYKLAARIFEVVTGTGMAKELVMRKGKRYDWTLIPLGSDCEYYVKEKLEAMLANVNATESIWRSTDMAPEELRLIPRSVSTTKAKM